MRVLALLVAVFAFAAAALPLATVTIKTNAVCEMCERNIEKALAAVDGIDKADLVLETKEVHVTYDADKIDVTTIRQAISAAGYQADEVPARPKARENLTNCCKGDAPLENDKPKACKSAGKKSCSKTCDKPKS